MLKLSLIYGNVRPLFRGESRHDAVLRAMRRADGRRVAGFAHPHPGR